LATTARSAFAKTLRRDKSAAAKTVRRDQPGTVSLERALSKLGLTSRKTARELILAGRVSVDGRTITNPSLRLVPERVEVRIDGAAHPRPQPLTIVLHKPRGYVTTRVDPQGRKTIYDLLADVPQRVVPVGRLDLATSGLLLLTTDTQLANWLIDPQSAVPRIYLVAVKGRVDDQTAAQLIDGVSVNGQTLAAAGAIVRKASGRESHLVITLHEGKNREVRRLMESVGHPVTRLKRVQFGKLELGTLAPGQWREVPAEELRKAFPGYPRRRAPIPK
jgi:23S rRNA pseudouridine2605 synthase